MYAIIIPIRNNENQFTWFEMSEKPILFLLCYYFEITEKFTEDMMSFICAYIKTRIN